MTNDISYKLKVKILYNNKLRLNQFVSIHSFFYKIILFYKLLSKYNYVIFTTSKKY